MTRDGQPVQITHFSDILCVWAYIAEARIEAVKRRFGDRVELEHRFCSVFGDTAERIGKGWAARGGYQGFGAHVREAGAGFEHVEVHPDLWLTVRPPTSASAHLGLKAVQLAEQAGELGEMAGDQPGASVLERLPARLLRPPSPSYSSSSPDRHLPRPAVGVEAFSGDQSSKRWGS